MKKTIIAGGLAAASLAALIAGAALAQQTPRSFGPCACARAEARRALPLSQAEFVQARVGRLTALDTNHDGTVTAEEMRAGARARRGRTASHAFRPPRRRQGRPDQPRRVRCRPVRPGRDERAGHRGPRGGEHRGQRMGRRGQGHGPGQRMAQHGPIVIADVQSQTGRRLRPSRRRPRRRPEPCGTSGRPRRDARALPATPRPASKPRARRHFDVALGPGFGVRPCRGRP
jgi:hypothetical protein